MSRFGRYELIRPLGSGGMGRVMEGRMRGPGGFEMPVAIKTLHDGAESLRREARIGGLLRHDNLVDVYEVGEHEGTWFCAMELCPGGTLLAHLPLPPRAVVEVGLAVCRALSYAHEALGLVHQDLKPENLLLTADGAVKVADLGVALAEGFGGDRRVRGTRGYMAPEQATGGVVDARADVYALGVTLLELATGAPPGQAATQDWDALDDSTGAPSGATPEWLAEVYERATAPLALRYASMDELAAALQALPVEGPGLREVLGIGPATAPARPSGTNLPVRGDAFVGRRTEREALSGWLGEGGVVVIVGPPGVGKSRLALEVARAARAERGWEAWLLDLEPARTTGDLLLALAGLLDLPVKRGDAAARIGEALADRGPSVWILDQVDGIADLGPLVAQLAAKAPEARFVLNLGKPLELPGVHGLRLGPLEGADAMDLLSDRARRRGAEVSADPSLAELAHRLDGLPLALELAAGRLGVLSVRDVIDRLSLSLLRTAGDGRTGALTDALQWSWGLLGEAERAALAQLSVFAGDFGIPAAEEVLDLGGAPVLDTLDGLVRASWILPGAGDRPKLLSSVREFAASHLADPEPVELRHARHYARFGTPEAVGALDEHGGEARRAQRSADLANLQRAFDASMAHGWPTEALLTLAAAWAVIQLTGPLSDVLGRAERLQTLPLAEGRVRALQLLADVLTSSGRELEAAPYYDEALALAEARGEPSAIARVCASMANACYQRHRIDDGQALYDRALALHRQLGHRREEGVVLGNLALLIDDHVPPAEGIALHERALAIHREVGNRRSEGSALMNLGNMCRKVGRIEEARAWYEQADAVASAVRSTSLRSLILGNLGNLHSAQGRPHEALEALTLSLKLTSSLGNQRAVSILQNSIANVHANLGDPQTALRWWAQAREGNLRRGDRAAQIYVLTSEASVLTALGRLPEARDRLEEALAGAREVKDALIEGLALGAMGSMAADEGRLDEAWAFFEPALAILRGTGARRYEAQMAVEAARVWLISDPDRAAEMLAGSRAILEEVGDLSAVAAARAIEAERLWLNGDPEGARLELAAAEAAQAGPAHRHRIDQVRRRMG